MTEEQRREIERRQADKHINPSATTYNDGHFLLVDDFIYEPVTNFADTLRPGAINVLAPLTPLKAFRP